MLKNTIVWEETWVDEPLYIQLYYYYKQLIVNGTLQPETKLPSIRRCALERRVSRTTVETAYAQLAAEGYIAARAGSGFYVEALDYKMWEKKVVQGTSQVEKNQEILYDFSSARVDPKSFNFDIWRRYIKSALRNVERLLSYGDPQGEYDLRKALSDYIREKRGVACTPEQIVIGAGMQSLIHILCSLRGQTGHIAFTGSSYRQGKAVFEDRGYTTSTYERVDHQWQQFEADKVDLIYTSPSHVTPWGEVMPMKTRLELLDYARRHQTLIIEDDYDSEFGYYNRPTPALQGIDGGENVVYMSTFSKLLLPSLRLSFMVLPVGLVEKYKEKGKDYNQTASKAEQIALCQFIRDGHLEKQIRRAKKLYMYKKEVLCQSVQHVFGEQATILSGTNCFLIQIAIKTVYSTHEVVAKAEKRGVRLKAVEDYEGGETPRVLLACSGVSEDVFEVALQKVYEAINKV